MTDTSFTDVTLTAFKLALNVRQIAREHRDETWNQHPNDITGRTWGLEELADHISAIYTVLTIIGETPNGYINREALEGLRREFEPAIGLLETDWAKQCLDELGRRLFDEDAPVGDPDQ